MSERFLSISQESLLPEPSALIAGANSVGEEASAGSSDKDDDDKTGELHFLIRSLCKRISNAHVPPCYNCTTLLALFCTGLLAGYCGCNNSAAAS